MVWLTGSGPGHVAKADFSVVSVLGSTAASCSRGDDSNSRGTMLGRLRFIDGGEKDNQLSKWTGAEARENTEAGCVVKSSAGEGCDSWVRVVEL